MPEPAKVTKAKLQQIRLADGDNPSQETNPDADLEVQFNPETLKVTYSNTLNGDDQSGGSAIQYVSKSSTKLAVELWFDASARDDLQDVREETRKVNHFITPIPQGDGLAPPAVRFIWGSFLFEGVMESMDETLEFFSAEGRPLRAKASISITSQEIQFQIANIAASEAATPGTTPQAPVSSGNSLQGVMGQNGSPDGWQSVAAANGIENPRLLEAGSFVDLSAGASAGVNASVGADLGVGFGASAGLSASSGLSVETAIT
jgi:hypothetical protein